MSTVHEWKNGSVVAPWGWQGSHTGKETNRFHHCGKAGIATEMNDCLTYLVCRDSCAKRDAEVTAELHGQTVKEGSVMLFLLGSANRDERVFPDSDRFDIHRKIGRHLGFGCGPHFCLGASLARLEGRVGLDEVLNRFPDWEVDSNKTVFRMLSVSGRGWDSMPVFLR